MYSAFSKWIFSFVDFCGIITTNMDVELLAIYHGLTLACEFDSKVASF